MTPTADADDRRVEAPQARPADRNRTTVRRALRAGLYAGLGVVLLLVPTLFSESGPGGAVLLSAGIAAGTLVTAGWLLLAAGLDLFAGEPMDLRRALWTAGATVAALLGPFLLLGTLSQAAMRGAGG